MRTLILIITVAVLFCGGGCDNEPAPSRLVNPRPPIPTYQQSPEALAGYAAQLLDAQPTKIDAFYSLFYAESEAQEWWLKFVRSRQSSTAAWHTALDQAFGENACDTEDLRRYFKLQVMAEPITHREERRAEARWQIGDNQPTILYLVQMNGAWHISAYSLEHIPESNDRFDLNPGRMPDRPAAEIQEMYTTMEELLPEADMKALAARVRRGEFADCDAANQAFLQMLIFE